MACCTASGDAVYDDHLRGGASFWRRLAPNGQRRSALEEATRRMFAEDFPGRVLTFDRSAAREFAVVAMARKRRGRPISTFDAQIAAIARAHGAAMASRNIADFDGCGVDAIDPWNA